jgi:hypothetical protein
MDDAESVTRLVLSNLNPARIDPRELVNRERDVEWLRDNLTAYLGAEDPCLGGAICILGEKGIGKSILAHAVIDELRQIHTATTLFISVDCRPLRNQRDVYREAATVLVDELTRRSDIAEPLRAAARAFDNLTRFDEVKLGHAHELLLQHRVGLNLGGGSSLFKWLEAKLDIVISRSKKIIESLQGTVVVDGPRLREAFVQLLADVERHAKLRVVLHLDNMEELDHEAMRDPVARERVRGEIEALLHLAEGPMGLVLTMRTYYSSVLTRRISKRRALGRLNPDELERIFVRRVERETSTVQAELDVPEVRRAITELAKLARTPLAFLTWAEYLLEEGLWEQTDLANALLERLATHYSTIARHIPKVAALFPDADSLVELDAVRQACDGNDPLVRQLLDHQVLLPVNYWDPREFFLDPELGFLIGRADLVHTAMP